LQERRTSLQKGRGGVLVGHASRREKKRLFLSQQKKRERREMHLLEQKKKRTPSITPAKGRERRGRCRIRGENYQDASLDGERGTSARLMERGKKGATALPKGRTRSVSGPLLRRKGTSQGKKKSRSRDLAQLKRKETPHEVSEKTSRSPSKARRTGRPTIPIDHKRRKATSTVY